MVGGPPGPPSAPTGTRVPEHRAQQTGRCWVCTNPHSCISVSQVSDPFPTALTASSLPILLPSRPWGPGRPRDPGSEVPAARRQQQSLSNPVRRARPGRSKFPVPRARRKLARSRSARGVRRPAGAARVAARGSWRGRSRGPGPPPTRRAPLRSAPGSRPHARGARSRRAQVAGGSGLPRRPGPPGRRPERSACRVQLPASPSLRSDEREPRGDTHAGSTSGGAARARPPTAARCVQGAGRRGARGVPGPVRGAWRAAGVPAPGPPRPQRPARRALGVRRRKRWALTRAAGHRAARAGLCALTAAGPSGPSSRAAPRRRAHARPREARTHGTGRAPGRRLAG